MADTPKAKRLMHEFVDMTTEYVPLVVHEIWERDSENPVYAFRALLTEMTNMDTLKIQRVADTARLALSGQRDQIDIHDAMDFAMAIIELGLAIERKEIVRGSEHN